MKKNYQAIILFTSLIFSLNSFAASHVVTVQNYQFDPATLNVSVGDTIMWQWVNGYHTTSSTSNIPAGAAAWDSPMTSASTSFMYVVTVAGTYHYQCNIHGPSMNMVAEFTATGTSGISSPSLPIDFNVYSVNQMTYSISYTLLTAANVQLSVFDLTGKSVKSLSSSFQSSGQYKENYFLDDLQRGIYLVELIAGNQRLSKRIVIE